MCFFLNHLVGRWPELEVSRNVSKHKEMDHYANEVQKKTKMSGVEVFCRLCCSFSLEVKSLSSVKLEHLLCSCFQACNPLNLDVPVGDNVWLEFAIITKFN